MKLRKISHLLFSALIIGSMMTPIYATGTGIGGLEIIDGSVIINKNSNNNSSSTLVPNSNLTEVRKEQGSITITLEDTQNKDSKSDVQFAMSKIADIKDGQYQLVDQFKATGVDLNKLKTANDLELVAQKLKKVASPENIFTTDANGSCYTDELDVGVYLFYATETNKYDQITPFIISIPTYSDNDKMMLYDVQVIPKHEPYPEMEVNRKDGRYGRYAPSTGTNLNISSDIVISIGALGTVFIIYKVKNKMKKDSQD